MLLTAFAAAFLASVPYLLSPLRDPEPISAHPLRELAPDRRLEAAEHLFPGEVIGPEALVVEADGSLITGLADGRIVRLFTDTEDGRMKYDSLGRTGEDDPNCGKDIDLEPKCGRPLGLHLTNGGKALLIADGYKGLLSLDLESRTFSVLATNASDGTPLQLLNSVQENEGGSVIYITDTSTEFQRRRIFWAVFSGKPTGRLLAYHHSNKSLEVVIDNLFMPNGLTFDHDNKCMLIALTISSDVLRYCPDEGMERLSIFASDLPGTLDNIHKYVDPESGRRVYLLGLGSKRAKPFSLLTFVAGLPNLRRWICGLPIPYEWLYKLVPKIGMLAILNEEGKLIGTLQDPKGRTYWVSEGIVTNGSLWLGSWLAPHIARLPAGAQILSSHI
mmetsp:Transcript_11505/g.28336  ORF Transcript_11505/g.28336 Transcript_11505/m.28336 type:complete len:388 (-) Transcript_11505:117-1280(-)